jgi:hypothetical protein
VSREYEHSTLSGNASRSLQTSYILKPENECGSLELTKEVALFCIMDLMKMDMTFTAMVMAKMSPDEHYSEHSIANIHMTLQLFRTIQMLIK